VNASDARWTEVALAEARSAADLGEVPVGAVHVLEGRGSARGRNRTIIDGDPTAHAEIVAIRAAAETLGNHRIGGTLYVSLEPCAMCMGALLQARVERLVFAALDPKAGAAVSLYRLGDDERLNHRLLVEQGPLGEESAELLREFFRARRE
jgi:tRNA(adenine34) deaminase